MKKPTSFSFDDELLNRLKKVSEDTMIPQTRLVEKGILHVLDKLEKKEDSK